MTNSRKDLKLKDRIFRKGKSYLCVDSTSNAYTKGEEYTCYIGELGKPAMRGNDGYEDLASMLLSRFKEVNVERIKK